MEEAGDEKAGRSKGAEGGARGGGGVGVRGRQGKGNAPFYTAYVYDVAAYV